METLARHVSNIIDTFPSSHTHRLMRLTELCHLPSGFPGRLEVSVDVTRAAGAAAADVVVLPGNTTSSASCRVVSRWFVVVVDGTGRTFTDDVRGVKR